MNPIYRAAKKILTATLVLALLVTCAPTMWQQAFAEGRPEGYPLPSDELAPALGASGEAKMIWSLATSTQMAAAAQGAVCDFPPRPEMVHGKWGDDYVPGDRVAITANPPGWQIFQPWRMDVDEAVLVNTYSATIPMSSKAVGDTAAYDTVYTVTVNNGLGSGVYYSDTAVTISAYTPEIGQRFQEWVVDDPPDLTLDDPFADETTFVMPNGNVEITATYADTKAYTVTVVGGNMGSGSYREGEEVWIFADALSQGRPFEKWVVNSGGAHIQDPTQRFTSFIMPATDVTVTATYQSPRTSYYVTVNGGAGSGVYYEGNLVRIYPFDFDTDQTFKEWVINSGDISLEDPTVADNSFIMPENPVEITATYEVADRYHSVTIQSGLGGTASAGETSARAGAVIALTATADPGYGFKEWQVVSGDVGIENNHFTMPDEDVTIRAVFEKKTDTGGTSSSGRSSASSGRRDTVTAKTRLPASAFSWDGDRTLTIDHERVTALGLLRVEWDGAAVTGYSVHRGSVIIRFDRAFVGSQAPGSHTVRVEFLNHTGETTVTVGGAAEATGAAGSAGEYNPATGDDGQHNPQTGDFAASPWIWLAALIPAAVLTTGSAALLLKRWPKKRLTGISVRGIQSNDQK